MIYFDNACTTLRPESVAAAIADQVRTGAACHGRSYHRLGRAATDTLARARHAVLRLIGAERPEEVIFVRSATEGLNMVARSLGLGPGDVVLTTDQEHNANLIPWQRLTRSHRIRHEIMPLGSGFDMAEFRRRLRRGVRLVSVFHTSNLTGATLPVAEICHEARRHKSLVLIDGAQSVMTHEIDLASMGADFFVFSLHKMMGPTGLGVLWGRAALLERLEPLIVGGDTVTDATYGDCTFAPLPARLEAGVANLDAAAGVEAAVDYLLQLERRHIHSHVVALNEIATEGLRRIPRVRVLGPPAPAERGAIVNFTMDGVGSHSLARLLDERAGVMVRHGKHCGHAWYNALGVEESVRASFAVYNTEAEVEVLLETVAKVDGMLE